MDLKQGLSKLKSQRGTPLHFFYCDKGSDDKPVVVLDSKSVSADAEKELKAKGKVKARGKMLINEAGDLCITPKGSAPGGLERGVETASKAAGVRSCFLKIQITAAAAEGDDGGAPGPAAQAQPMPKAPPAQGNAPLNPRPNVPPPGTAAYVGPGPQLNPARPSANGYGDASVRVVNAPPSPYGSASVRDVESPEAAYGNAPVDEAEEVADSYGNAQRKYPPSQADQAGSGSMGYSDPEAAGSMGYSSPDDGYSDPNANVAAAAAPQKKTYADPMRKSSAMNALLDLKKKTEVELTALGSDPGASAEKIQQLEKRLDQIELQMKNELRKQATTGVSPKALGTEYKDEDTKVGWRAWGGKKPPSPGETDEQVAARLGGTWTPALVRQQRKAQEANHVVRNNFTPDEKQAATMRVGDDGLLHDGDGNLVNTDVNTEFVADPETGDLLRFHNKEVDTDIDARDAAGNPTKQKQHVFHSSPLSGKDVTAAGAIDVKDGEITRVSNISGHYKPEIAEMLQFLEGLLRKGALLDKEWAGPDGRELMGQAKGVYDAAIAVQNKLKAKAEQGKDVKEDVAVIEKAMAMLKKLGCGPTNKINTNVQVEFLDVTPEMAGLQIKQAAAAARANPKQVDNFLQGGDNKTQQTAKKTMQDELKQDPRAQQARQRDDQLAEKRAARIAPKSTADAANKVIKEQLAKLEAALAAIPPEKPLLRREVEGRIAGLRKKLAAVAEPTSDDLKEIMRTMVEIKARLDEEEEQEVEGEGDADANPLDFAGVEAYAETVDPIQAASAELVVNQ
jgi:hypothetical protein